LVVCAVVALFPGVARGGDPLPADLEQVDIVEHLGAQIPEGLRFVDSTGQDVALGQYFRQDKPIVLTMVYFGCPMLCSLVVRGLIQTVNKMGSGRDRAFAALTVSFDPHDNAQKAATERARYTRLLGERHTSTEWSFLTGSEPSIRALADAVGFKYSADAARGQFAHAAVVMVLTPDGKMSRYLYGIDPPRRDLELALVEAGQGRWGTSFDRFLLHCYQWDPASRRYGLFVRNYFRIGGVVILSLLGGVMAWLWRREARRRAVAA
jgi:protein SCO1/2